jgi:DNA-binding Lrp family transcriptional regulator
MTIDDGDIKVLGVLMVYGPCANAEVARHAEMKPARCYRRILPLVKSGYIVHRRTKVYELTESGRRIVIGRQKQLTI